MNAPSSSPDDATLTVVILAFNERKHLARAIASVRRCASEIVVVDSFSTDDTVAIARREGATVLQHAWENHHARQFNWALDQLEPRRGWIVRLDADEYFTEALAEALPAALRDAPPDVTGLCVRRRIHFMGRWLRHGRVYPMWVLRVWRAGAGRCEDRWMDEHVLLSNGRAVRLEHDIIDDNLNDLSWWTAKHNGYATREAADLLALKYGLQGRAAADAPSGGQASLRRWAKVRVYARLPLFVRPLLFFVYRYVVRLGFLDGRAGLVWHVLQGFWYRFLVDAKIAEAERGAGRQPEALAAFVEREWGLK